MAHRQAAPSSGTSGSVVGDTDGDGDGDGDGSPPLSSSSFSGLGF
jgi:hypothetical protein